VAVESAAWLQPDRADRRHAHFGILLALAMPGFSNWLRNARVRTTAESVQNGLQLARAEAVRRNTPVASSRQHHRCRLRPRHCRSELGRQPRRPERALRHPPSADTDPRIIQSRSAAEGGAATTIASVHHRLASTAWGAPRRPAMSISRARDGEACLEDGGPVRCLRVVVSLGGQIRMCDPALPDGDAQACRP
jgi:type IV fimbrial biogenesis protein FimT